MLLSSEDSLLQKIDVPGENSIVLFSSKAKRSISAACFINSRADKMCEATFSTREFFACRRNACCTVKYRAAERSILTRR